MQSGCRVCLHPAGAIINKFVRNRFFTFLQACEQQFNGLIQEVASQYAFMPAMVWISSLMFPFLRSYRGNFKDMAEAVNQAIKHLRTKRCNELERQLARAETIIKYGRIRDCLSVKIFSFPGRTRLRLRSITKRNSCWLRQWLSKLQLPPPLLPLLQMASRPWTCKWHSTSNKCNRFDL